MELDQDEQLESLLQTVISTVYLHTSKSRIRSACSRKFQRKRLRVYDVDG